MYGANREFNVVFQCTNADVGDLNPLVPDVTLCHSLGLLLSHAQNEFDVFGFFGYFDL